LLNTITFVCSRGETPFPARAGDLVVVTIEDRCCPCSRYCFSFRSFKSEVFVSKMYVISSFTLKPDCMMGGEQLCPLGALRRRRRRSNNLSAIFFLFARSGPGFCNFLWLQQARSTTTTASSSSSSSEVVQPATPPPAKNLFFEQQEVELEHDAQPDFVSSSFLREEDAGADELRQVPQKAVQKTSTTAAGYETTAPQAMVDHNDLPESRTDTFTFDMKGGEQAGMKFQDSVKIASNLANVGDAKIS
ncbi:unnamed protein product, partial [Amoebophrya sp. A120]